MKKQDMLKLAIIGLMAGSSALSAQGSAGQAPSGSCHAAPPSNTAQPAPQGSCKGTAPQDTNGSSSQAPGGKAAQSKKQGVDTSIRSNYSNSNQQKTSANRAYESRCGTGSCNGSSDEDSTPPKPQPAPSAQASAKRSTNK